MPVEYGTQRVELPLVIVAGDRPALLGRNWFESIQLESIKLDWPSIQAVTVGTGVASVDDVVKQHLSVFKDDYGLIQDFKITIHLRPDTTPVFRKARPIPFARLETVAAELDRLEANRIITKVERSDWAAPTVNVLKPDKSIRICGDYTVTVTPRGDVDQYPLPTAADIFSTLAGGVKFTKLDLAHAYNQLELDDASKQMLMLTINTHKGPYQPNRLSYGVNSAPAIFQRTIDQILAGMDGVACYLDDILITADTVFICNVWTKFRADWNGSASGLNCPSADS